MPGAGSSASPFRSRHSWFPGGWERVARQARLSEGKASQEARGQGALRAQTQEAPRCEAAPTRQREGGGAMKRIIALSGAVLIAALCASPAEAAFSDYGIESVGSAISTTQAGAHPDFTVDFTLKTDPSTPPDPTGLHEPYARTRDLTVGLPPGLIGNPHAVAQCTAQQFATALAGGGCPQDSQVGVAVVRIYSFGFPLTEPIYNMAPPSGEVVARLGLYAATSPVYIDVQVRSEGDYGLDSMLRGISGTERVVGSSTTIWGVPADSSHDTLRLTPEEAFNGASSSPPRKSGLPEELPFLSNPTSCGKPQEVVVEADSYQDPDQVSVA